MHYPFHRACWAHCAAKQSGKPRCLLAWKMLHQIKQIFSRTSTPQEKINTLSFLGLRVVSFFESTVYSTIAQVTYQELGTMIHRCQIAKPLRRKQRQPSLYPGQAVLFAANSLYLSHLERPLLCWSGESGTYVSTKAAEFLFRLCKIWGPLLQQDSPPRLVCMRDLQQPKRTAQQCWLANTVRVSDYSTQKMVGTLIADTQASNSLNTYKGRIAPTSAQRNSAKAGKWVHSISQTPAQCPSH